MPTQGLPALMDTQGVFRTWAPFLVVVVASAALGYGAEWLVVRLLRRLGREGQTKLQELFVPAIQPAFGIIVFAAGLWYGAKLLGTDVQGPILGVARRGSFAIAILFGALVCSRLFTGLLRYVGEHREKFRHAGYLGSRLTSLFVWALALMWVFDFYNVSVTPVLTGLGLAALAIGLSLQDTLRNLFAGIWIQTGHSLQPGHYVLVQQSNPANNLQGFVVSIGWRTTEIRTITHDVAVIPNSELAQATIIDYHLPDPTTALRLPLTVGYETDVDHLERVVLDEVEAAFGQVPGIVREPKPYLRFTPGFGEWSLNFTLWVYVRNYFDQFLAESELRKRLLKRFRTEGFRIPYPIRESVVPPRDRADLVSPGTDGENGGAARVAPER